MNVGYCVYPPEIAADVEIAPQQDGERAAFIAGSASVGRYVLLRSAEHEVLSLLDGTRGSVAICEEFARRYGRRLAVETLTRFLTRLDDVGVLAGAGAEGRERQNRLLGSQNYIRLKLFNPERLFERIIPCLRWIWTPAFLSATLAMVFVAPLLSLMNRMEVASAAVSTVKEHYLAIFIAGTVVGFAHEFAHGLTCKAFGGRATEVGALMIYYVFPALYCNVSGIHLIRRRYQRLWVIAAGVYLQLLSSAASLLVWFLAAPHTFLSDVAFIVFLGSVLDVIVNANPLIKLDGYYFLTQWLRLPNLMNRSREHCRRLLKRWIFGIRGDSADPYSRRERTFYAAFGFISFVYGAGLRVFIVCYAGAYLMDWIHLTGLFLAAGLAVFYARHPLRHLIKPWEKIMATDNDAKNKATEPSSTRKFWRACLVPSSLILAAGAVLLMPWTGSVGNYGTLIAIPSHETIIRAPENGTLARIYVRPGDAVASGEVLGQMRSLDLDEQLAAVKTEIARAVADQNRLQGELHTRQESVVRAELLMGQREQEFKELDTEQRMIRRRVEEAKLRPAPFVTNVSLAAADQSGDPETFPPSMAALQAEIDSRDAQFQEGNVRRDRARKLFAEGLVARGELDAAETRASTLWTELAGARKRLEAALTEHRRTYTRSGTDLRLARSDLGAERLFIEKLSGDLQSARKLIGTLEERRRVLESKLGQFELTSPKTGAVFGEDLPRQTGHYFEKGDEILRVADTGQLLLRIQVPERQIGDVRLRSAVRLKSVSFPDYVFNGGVANIGEEAERDQYGQPTYRVELTIQNPDKLLRPGMTAFARIDITRQIVLRILLHKIKQTLRPELWML